jgi:sugar lactone lactonase YvrE
MLHRHARTLLTAALAAALVAVGSASTPVFWQVSSRADFLKGDVDNLSIDNDGRLSLGPATTLVYDSAAPFLWTLVPGLDGAVFAGSGNEGKVFRIDRDGKASVFYDAPELEIHAIAPGPNGGLYVAASPDGRIYKVDAKGQATPFYAPEDKYIWSLATDAAGNVYAGTGEKGVVYKVTPDGKGAPFYRTRSTNVVALAVDPAGNLLAGTESPGRVFRIDREGKGFVILESSYREIHSLRVDAKGVIYATAVSGQKGGGDDRAADLAAVEPAKSIPVPSVSTEITSISIIDVGAATSGDVKASSPRIGSRPSKGAVFRITPDGVWDTIWDSPEDTPYDLALDRDGGVLIGTGGKGKVFRVAGDPPRVTLLGRAAAQQVTCFLPLPGGDTMYATANPGKVFRLSAGRADRGTYESEVKDAQTVATWGAISWRGSVPSGTGLELRTRSGNSQTPDDTWSPWSDPYRNADGQQIQSPRARYLQWRATLNGKAASPILTSVTAAYLQRNLRPKVTGITVYTPGVVFQKPFSTGEAEIAGFEDGWPDTRPSPAALSAGAAVAASPLAGPPLGRRIYQKGLQAFSWKSDDENDDKLQYDVLYRREDETTWRTLRRALTDQLFVWDTTSIPNGTYVLRIVASDAPSNPPGAALSGEADSATFDVDNIPPAIRVLSARKDGNRTVLSFEVQDDQSAVQRVDYSLDANRWRSIYPKDGICDSRLEQFELTFEGDPASVVIRAVDAMSNVATARGSGK